MTLATTYRARGLAFLFGVGAAILVSWALFRYAMPGGTYSVRSGFLICVAIYLAFGVLAGFVWRDKGWQLGPWIAAPGWLLVLFAMLFAGYVNKFLTNDVPFLVTSVVAASLGGFIGGYIRAWLLPRQSER